MERYTTLAEYGCSEFIINKSRFIGHGTPAATEEEALAFLRAMREKYRDASHNCYAYIIGRNAGIQRYSDDGEPSGTAGLPIIEAMKARGIVDCAVVVTRYFGGVLLGAGGLVRAYSRGSSEAMRAARVVTMHQTEEYLAEIGYSDFGRVEHMLEGMPCRVENKEFGAAVELTLAVKQCDARSLLEALTTATNGGAEFLKTGEGFRPWEE